MSDEPRYLKDGTRVAKISDVESRTDYIRAWKEGKGRDAEIAVQVWKGKDKPEGEPDGDWGMPAVLGLEAAIAQAVVQS